MITFKQYINEGILSNIAALGIAGAAMTAPPAPQQQAQPTKQVQQAKPTYHTGTVDFIKNAEGFRDTSYADKNQFSVGYGTGLHVDGSKVKPGEKITKQQAHDMLVYHIENRVVPKASSTPVWEKMNDRQRGAFVSFLFNVGEGVVGNTKDHPKFNAALNSGDVDAVFDHMQTYNKSTETDKKTGKKVKVVNPGLVKRRQAERDFAYAKD